MPPLCFRSLLLFVVSVTSLHAASFELPPLNSPPSPEHHVGKIVWADLVTPNITAAEKFYGGLFGWSFNHVRAGESDYVLASVGGRPVAGLVEKPLSVADRRQSAWLTFIAVRDVDSAKRTALAHKGKLLADSVTYAMRGRQAVLSDPEGAVFAILASSSGDPPDYLAAPGEWIWASLHAKDPDSEASFYQTLFGYDVFDAESTDGMAHLILSSDDYARASANALPEPQERRHSHWLNFIRVDNAADLSAKAVALGGRVLVQPHPDRHGGMVAVVADPAGAPVGLMEWKDSDSKTEPK